MEDGRIVTEPKLDVQRSSVYDENAQANANAELQAQIFNMDVNYANQNKWFAYCPLEDVLGKKYKNLNLHLTKFNIPQLMQGTMETSFRGYSKEMPTKILNPSTKEITLEYIVDADWNNYRALYAFMSNINGTLNPVSTDEKTGILPSEYMPVRIYLLGPYKKKIIQFLFENCWIKVFNELQMDVNQPGEVNHSFTLCWDRYSIEDI